MRKVPVPIEHQIRFSRFSESLKLRHKALTWIQVRWIITEIRNTPQVRAQFDSTRRRSVTFGLSIKDASHRMFGIGSPSIQR